VKSYAGNGAKFGVQIEYAWDGEEQLGTAGAIRNALAVLPRQFLVLYGDSYLPCDYRQVEHAFFGSGAEALMTIIRNDDRWDRSNVEYTSGAIVKYDKDVRTPQMRHIDYGLGAFNASVFENVPANARVDLTAVYQRLLGANRLAALEMFGRFYETGSWAGIRDFEHYVSTLNTTEALQEGRPQ
jgi:NDP-sugar pyrophosphorylase family protein